MNEVHVGYTKKFQNNEMSINEQATMDFYKYNSTLNNIGIWSLGKLPNSKELHQTSFFYLWLCFGSIKCTCNVDYVHGIQFHKI